MSGRHVATLASMPSGAHWAILRFSRITIPGDERSRQAPGHGYPEHTEDVVGYQAFDSEAEFTAAIEQAARSQYDRDRIVGIHVDAQYRATTVVQLQAAR